MVFFPLFYIARVFVYLLHSKCIELLDWLPLFTASFTRNANESMQINIILEVNGSLTRFKVKPFT